MTEAIIMEMYGKSIWEMSCSEIMGNGLLSTWSELRRKKKQENKNNDNKSAVCTDS